jgi:CRAL/TRIO, N-terminal domain
VYPVTLSGAASKHPRSTSDLSVTGLIDEHAIWVLRDMDSSFVSRDINTLDPKDVDSLMAQQMMQMSMKEREEVYCDLHGVADEVKETPELIIQAINDMKLELSKIQNATAYQQALAQDSKYVHRHEFLLRFLRAERFDVVRAAIRLVNFYSLKLQAFGLEKLTKDIFQEDLTENERKGLYESMTYDLPFRDRAGRTIIFKMGTSVSIPMHELLRRGMYASLSYSRDEENQRKGLVLVAYHMGDEYRPEDSEQRWEVHKHWARLLACVPLRYQAIHICFDSPIWRATGANFRISVDLFSGLRTMVRDFSCYHFLLSLCSSTCLCLSPGALW